jgi:hypothetical protein
MTKPIHRGPKLILEKPPKKFDFGYGFVVKIKYVKRLDGADAAWYGPTGSDAMTIKVRDRIPLDRKHEVIAHELVHAALDFFQWVRDNISDTIREEMVQTRIEEAKRG